MRHNIRCECRRCQGKAGVPLVRCYMTSSVRTVQPNDITMVAAKTMADAAIRHLVVTEGQFPVGVFSQRDLIRHISRQYNEGADPSQTYVWEFMSTPVVTVDPATTLAKAAEVMQQRKLGCLPVVKGGNDVAGILTRSDLLEYIAEQHQAEPPPFFVPSVVRVLFGT